ncbi:hypothetical protein T069G_08479 [Trichoderma breve]|uniref:Tetraspanin Tsp3 n=1 Tax=Trichoderma breve TaxID=2034170 RepID=A0A9W9B7V6_9HYPO|nr:hypothetical protein T069G_08479 [Trichoderma breve]KAJ4857582.1 hypothetical protein T069G_08479 [Trichoderma breve]
MGLGLGLAFMLGSAVLFGVAAVVHFHSAHLSLPVSPAITILTILLPIVSFLNSYIYPTLLHSARNSSHPLHRLSPTILQTLQGLVTTILATLLFEDVIPSTTVDCVMENRWKSMFQAHDGESIRLIQDTLNCCGLNTVRHMPYPFIKPDTTCSTMYGRDKSCRGPWTAALRSSTGADFGVVIAVGLLQILSLLMTREGTNWWNSWRPIAWHRQRRGVEGERRALLEDVTDADEEVVERQDDSSRSRGYQSLPSAEAENRPRVEPSPIHHEENHWRDS